MLEVKAKYLTASAASFYNEDPNTENGNTAICEGDYIVTLSISGNTGFAVTGYRIFYNPNVCRPLVFNNNQLVHTRESVLNDASITPTTFRNNGNNNEYIMAFGTMSLNNAVTDGKIISFFVRPCRSGVDLSVDDRLSATEEKYLITNYEAESWLNAACQPVQHTDSNEFTVYHYVDTVNAIYGDINNNHVIDSSDAQLLLQILTNNNFYIDMDNYDAIYIVFEDNNTQGYYLIAVGDVNGDGNITVADAQDILSYYSTYIVSGATGYDGIIGTPAYVFKKYTRIF